MPIYEKEKEDNVKQAIESIIDQTFKPDEFVIVQDGIITNSLECLIETYKEKFPGMIKIVKVKEKSTLGKALAIGVKNCKNEYIARMDADDVAINTRLEKQVEILENNPEIDILGGIIEEYDENMEKKVGIRNVPIETESIRKFIKYQCPFNHSTVIFKKSTILKIGNYKDIPIEDYELWARMLKNNCVMKNCNEVLVKYRTSREMYKRRSGVKRIKDLIRIEKILLEYGIINRLQFTFNVFFRMLFAILPVNFKIIMYKLIRGK